MSEETSTIDEKKGKKDFQIDAKGFILSLIKLIIGIAIFFTFAAINLYLSKLAESNVLPTSMDCFPYTNNKITITELQQGSNIFYHGNNSMKIQFDPSKINDGKEKYVLLDILRNNKTPDTNFLTNYLISILEHLFQFNYSAYNTYFNSLNSLPEIVIIFISQFCTTFYSLILGFVNIFYFVFIWFYCMNEFFKSNTLVGIFFVILFSILLFFVIGLSPLLMSTIMFSCILSMCSYKAAYLFKNDNNASQKKSITALNVIKDLFVQYKTTITSIFALFFILNTFTYLGNIPGLVIAIVTLIAYLGYFSIPFFKPINVDNKLTPNILVEQATKTCSPNAIIKDNSIINSVMNFLSLFASPKKGGAPVLNKDFLLKLQKTL